MSIRQQLHKLAYQAGGHSKTREARQNTMNQLCNYLQKQNIQIKDIKHLKYSHVEQFIATRKNQNLKLRTIQNDTSAIRGVLRQANRHKLAQTLNNKTFGLTGASRDGTKTAMSKQRFHELLKIVENKDVGVAAVARLEWALGLRAEEAVKACKSLKKWEKQLVSGEPVHVIYGTKGGRQRYIYPHDREDALQAVKHAITIAQTRENKRLIDRDEEKKAMNRYKNVMYAAGFRGKESGHSLRYAFTQRQIEASRIEGYDEEDALMLASRDLGHGDGRGRYIKRVYGR